MIQRALEATDRVPPVRMAPAPAAGRGATPGLRAGRTTARRRRTGLVLASAVAALGLAAALTGWSGLIWAVGAVALVALAWVGLVRRVRRLAVEREMAAAFARPAPIDWDAFGRELALAALDPAATAAPTVAAAPTVTAGADLSGADLLRFVGLWSLGVVLTPVGVAYRLAGGDLSDLERNGWIDRLARIQAQGRSQSIKVLTAGVVATAGVTSVGSLFASASASPALSARAGATYTVRAGDTLGSIAAAHGTSIAALAETNGISDPNLIIVGQVLDLPSGTTSTSPALPARAGATYTVRAGDTLGSIAAAHGTSVAALVAANGISDPNLIFPGEVLALAGGTGAASAGAAVSTAAASSGGAVPARYTVRAGDTLGAIAARYGTTVAALAARNHLADPNELLVGQVLAITGTAPAPAVTSASATVGATTSGESAAAATAVRVAHEVLGVPYVWAGATPSGFDCSGLVMYAYAAAGVSLPHYTVSQYDDTARVAAGDLEPGDLVFYDTGDGAQPGHVALYIGGGEVISANSPGTVVQIQSITYDGTPMGYGRVG